MTDKDDDDNENKNTSFFGNASGMQIVLSLFGFLFLLIGIIVMLLIAFKPEWIFSRKLISSSFSATP